MKKLLALTTILLALSSVALAQTGPGQPPGIQGPASATDSNLACYNGTSGKLLKDCSKATSAFSPAGTKTEVTGSDPTITATTWSTNPSYVITGSGRTLTIPSTATLSNNSQAQVDANGASATVSANALDTITFAGSTTSTGGSVVLPKGGFYNISTDGAGHIRISDAVSKQVGQTFVGEQRNSWTTLTISGSTFTPDNSNNNYKIILTGADTLANPTALTAGAAGVIEIDQDATGGRTLALGSAYIAAGGATSLTLSAGASVKDFFSYLVLAGGTQLLISPGALNATH